MWAAKNGHTECVRALVEAGADQDANDMVSTDFPENCIRVTVLVRVPCKTFCMCGYVSIHLAPLCCLGGKECRFCTLLV
jgi:hypothetical protein